MAIMVPPEVGNLFMVLTGEKWPQINEDELKQLGEAWKRASTRLQNELRPEIAAVVKKIREEFHGKAANRFADRMAPLIDSPSPFDAIGESFEDSADFLRQMALQTEYVKLVTILSLIELLAEMAWAIAMSGLSFGESMVWLAGRYAVMRFLLDRLWGRLIMRVVQAQVFGILLQVAIDAGAQLIQIAKGSKGFDEWDKKATVQAVEVGSLGGALALPLNALGGALGNLFSKTLTKTLGNDVDKQILKAAADSAAKKYAKDLPNAKSLASFATKISDHMNTHVGKDLGARTSKNFEGMSLKGMYAHKAGQGLGDVLQQSLHEWLTEATYNASQGKGFQASGFAATAGAASSMSTQIGSIIGAGIHGNLTPGNSDNPFLADSGGSGKHGESDGASTEGKTSSGDSGGDSESTTSHEDSRDRASVDRSITTSETSPPPPGETGGGPTKEDSGDEGSTITVGSDGKTTAAGGNPAGGHPDSSGSADSSSGGDRGNPVSADGRSADSSPGSNDQGSQHPGPAPGQPSPTGSPNSSAPSPDDPAPTQGAPASDSPATSPAPGSVHMAAQPDTSDTNLQPGTNDQAEIHSRPEANPQPGTNDQTGIGNQLGSNAKPEVSTQPSANAPSGTNPQAGISDQAGTNSPHAPNIQPGTTGNVSPGGNTPATSTTASNPAPQSTTTNTLGGTPKSPDTTSTPGNGPQRLGDVSVTASTKAPSTPSKTSPGTETANVEVQVDSDGRPVDQQWTSKPEESKTDPPGTDDTFSTDDIITPAKAPPETDAPATDTTADAQSSDNVATDQPGDARPSHDIGGTVFPSNRDVDAVHRRLAAQNRFGDGNFTAFVSTIVPSRRGEDQAGPHTSRPVQVGGQTMNAEQFADVLMSPESGWNGKDPIMLVSNDADHHHDQFASELSAALGEVPVTPIRMSDNGSIAKVGGRDGKAYANQETIDAAARSLNVDGSVSRITLESGPRELTPGSGLHEVVPVYRKEEMVPRGQDSRFEPIYGEGPKVRARKSGGYREYLNSSDRMNDVMDLKSKILAIYDKDESSWNLLDKTPAGLVALKSYRNDLARLVNGMGAEWMLSHSDFEFILQDKPDPPSKLKFLDLFSTVLRDRGGALESEIENLRNQDDLSITLPNDCRGAAERISGQAPADLSKDRPNPAVGQNYYKRFGNDEGWDTHYATVILKDGDTDLTFEAAADFTAKRIDSKLFGFFELYRRGSSLDFNGIIDTKNAEYAAKKAAGMGADRGTDETRPPAAAPPRTGPTAESNRTVPSTGDGRRFTSPEEWGDRRDTAPKATVNEFTFDPDKVPTIQDGDKRKRIEGSLPGPRTYINTEIRRFQAPNGDWVREYTIKVDLVSKDDQLSPEQRREVADRLRSAVDIHINQKYRLPGGDQLHVTTDFGTPKWDDRSKSWDVDSSQRPPVVVHNSKGGANQLRWGTGDDSLVHLHELMHYLGLKDTYETPGTALVREETKAKNEAERQGKTFTEQDRRNLGLMGPKLWENPVLTGKNLARLEEISRSGGVLHDHPLGAPAANRPDRVYHTGRATSPEPLADPVQTPAEAPPERSSTTRPEQHGNPPAGTRDLGSSRSPREADSFGAQLRAVDDIPLPIEPVQGDDASGDRRMDFDVKPRPRVLVVSDTSGMGGGGVPVFNMELVRGLAVNHDVTMLTVDPASDYDNERKTEEHGSADVVNVPTPEGTEPRDFFGQLVKQPANDHGLPTDPDSFDVIIGHSRFSGPGAQEVRQAWYPNAKLVHFLHTSPLRLDKIKGDPAKGGQKSKAERVAMRDADLVAGVGPLLTEEADRLSQQIQNVPALHQLVPGSAIGPITPRPEPDGGRSIKLLLPGRATDEIKGVESAIQAVGLLRKLGRNVELTIRGGPDPQNDLELHQYWFWQEFAEKYGRGGVTMLPFTTDAEELARDRAEADALIMPSLHEGFGLVATEAAGRGIPVLVNGESGAARFLEQFEEPDTPNPMVVDAPFEIDPNTSREVDGGEARRARAWALAISQLSKTLSAGRENAEDLHGLLEQYTWQHAADALVEAALETQGREGDSSHGGVTRQGPDGTLIRESEQRPDWEPRGFWDGSTPGPSQYDSETPEQRAERSARLQNTGILLDEPLRGVDKTDRRAETEEQQQDPPHQHGNPPQHDHRTPGDDDGSSAPEPAVAAPDSVVVPVQDEPVSADSVPSTESRRVVLVSASDPDSHPVRFETTGSRLASELGKEVVALVADGRGVHRRRSFPPDGSRPRVVPANGRADVPATSVAPDHSERRSSSTPEDEELHES